MGNFKVKNTGKHQLLLLRVEFPKKLNGKTN